MKMITAIRKAFDIPKRLWIPKPKHWKAPKNPTARTIASK